MCFRQWPGGALPISQNAPGAAVHLYPQAAGRTQLPLICVAGNVRAMKKAAFQVISQRSWRRPAGFTVLELMIAVAVLAILVGIGVPSFQEAVRRNRVATQTNNVISVLALARSEAVKRGTPVTVCPAAGTSGADQDRCSGDQEWAANGVLIFSDVRAPLGQVNAPTGEPANTNDAIIQRLPAASEQSMRIINARASLSYRPDGSVDLPIGTNATFVVAPTATNCVNPNGAREVQVIAAGRASFRKISCP